MPWALWQLRDAEYGYVILDPAHESPDRDVEPPWYRRERSRFLDVDLAKGTLYQYLPNDWQGLPQAFGHFPHYSLKSPGMIAFTASWAHGEADRQTVMKPGRYLTKYYPKLAPEEVARLAGQVSALAKPAEILWAREADEIVHVYRNGPRSCMSHDASDYATDGVHPVSVYAGPDTGIAYMCDGDGRITARTVVRFADDAARAWLRIYGDECRLSVALSAIGVDHDSGALRGARLLKIEHGDENYVCPYLDGAEDSINVDMDPEYLIVGPGDDRANRTDGLLREDDCRSSCDRCGDRYDDDELHYMEECDESMCSNCRDSIYIWSRYEDQYINVQDVVHVTTSNCYGGRRGDVVSQETIDNSGDFFTCELTGEVLHNDFAVQLVQFGDDFDDAVDVDCDAVNDGSYAECEEEHGYYFDRRDMVEIDGRLYWVNSDTAVDRAAGMRAPKPRVDDPRQEEIAI